MRRNSRIRNLRSSLSFSSSVGDSLRTLHESAGDLGDGRSLGWAATRPLAPPYGTWSEEEASGRVHSRVGCDWSRAMHMFCERMLLAGPLRRRRQPIQMWRAVVDLRATRSASRDADGECDCATQRCARLYRRGHVGTTPRGALADCAHLTTTREGIGARKPAGALIISIASTVTHRMVSHLESRHRLRLSPIVDPGQVGSQRRP